MKVVVAPDSFKDGLSAVEVCDTVKQALSSVCERIEVVCRPMANGGEGTAQAFMANSDGRWISQTVTGPLPESAVEAGYVWFEDTQTALVEMASASGLKHLTPQQRHPLHTTTLGTGQLLCAARDAGAQRILLGAGASATVDVGLGMAHALGWRFLDKQGRPVVPTGGSLLHIMDMAPPEEAWTIPMEVLCDIQHPLIGIQGAAHTFAPQKGATRPEVVQLEVALTHISDLIKRQLQCDIDMLPGAGAAGGLAAGAVAFCHATLTSGFDAVMAQCHLAEALTDADWVITGEGCFDAQSLSGKVITGVVKAAKEHNVKVAVLSGQVKLTAPAWKNLGIDSATAICPEEIDIEEAIRDAEKYLYAATQQWAKESLFQETL